MPIGNLTSQIFANIYLNELDRFVKHGLRAKYYLRYGDDFILIHHDLEKLRECRTRVTQFLNDSLRLNLNPRNDKIIKAWHGLRFLGVIIRTDGRSLNKRNMKRIKNRIDLKNAGSYYGLVKRHSLSEFRHEFDLWIYELLESEFYCCGICTTTFGVYAKSCAGTILPQGTHQCKFWANDNQSKHLIGE